MFTANWWISAGNKNSMCVHPENRGPERKHVCEGTFSSPSLSPSLSSVCLLNMIQNFKLQLTGIFFLQTRDLTSQNQAFCRNRSKAKPLLICTLKTFRRKQIFIAPAPFENKKSSVPEFSCFCPCGLLQSCKSCSQDQNLSEPCTKTWRLLAVTWNVNLKSTLYILVVLNLRNKRKKENVCFLSVSKTKLSHQGD